MALLRLILLALAGTALCVRVERYQRLTANPPHHVGREPGNQQPCRT